MNIYLHIEKTLKEIDKMYHFLDKNDVKKLKQSFKLLKEIQDNYSVMPLIKLPKEVISIILDYILYGSNYKTILTMILVCKIFKDIICKKKFYISSKGVILVKKPSILNKFSDNFFELNFKPSLLKLQPYSLYFSFMKLSHYDGERRLRYKSGTVKAGLHKEIRENKKKFKRYFKTDTNDFIHFARCTIIADKSICEMLKYKRGYFRQIELIRDYYPDKYVWNIITNQFAIEENDYLRTYRISL